MSSNFPEFALSLDKWIASTQVDADTAVRTLALEAFRRIVKRTPVDTGALRASWQISTTIPEPQLEAKSTTPLAPSTKGVTVKTGAYVTNPLVYAQVIEFGLFEPPDPGPSKDRRPDRTGRVLVSGGFSLQAPAGMVAVTAQELAGEFAT